MRNLELRVGEGVEEDEGKVGVGQTKHVIRTEEN